MVDRDMAKLNRVDAKIRSGRYVASIVLLLRHSELRSLGEERKKKVVPVFAPQRLLPYFEKVRKGRRAGAGSHRFSYF